MVIKQTHVFPLYGNDANYNFMTANHYLN